MNDILKNVQALEDSSISLKGVTKTIKNERKEQKEGFLGMLLGTLGATTMVITFWEFLMFYQFFPSPQVKRSLIISNKLSMYELPNNLRLRILGN